MRLTRVELRRLFSRRLTAIALLGALIVTGVMLFFAYQEAIPLSGAELKSQRVSFDQSHKDWETNGEQMKKDCLAGQAEALKQDPKADFGCNNMEPKWESWGKPQAKFTEMMPGVLVEGSYLLAAVAFLVGTGFVAAEFSTGSLANWLTFEPRRMRVYGSKLAATGLGLFPVAVALLGVLTAGVWLILGRYASTAGTTAKVWGDLAGVGGRGVVMALAVAMVGAATGVLLRHTAAVIGVVLGYVVLVEGVFGSSLQAARPWLMQLNAEGWLMHGTTFYINTCKTDSAGGYSCQGVEKALTFGHSSALLGALVVSVIALAAVVFRRRDVS